MEMTFKRLYATMLPPLVISGLAVGISNLSPTNAAQQDTTEVTTERAIFQTLVAGLKAHETSIITASAYLTTERYLHDSPALQLAYDTYATRDPNKAIWSGMLKKPPKLTLEFWAADGAKIREDEKPLVSSEGGDYTLAAYDGERLQVFFSGSEIVQEGDLGSWPINSSARVLQLSPGDAPRLSEVIEKMHARFVGEEMIGGLEAYKVESLPSPSGTIETWWIVPSRGYVVVKHESKSKERSKNGPITSWRLIEVIDKLVNPEKDLWLPVVKRSIKYVTVEKKEVWESIVRHSLLSLTINNSIPTQLFTLPLPPGSKVGKSEVEGGPYTVEGDEEQFESTLLEARASGEQPDLETVDMRTLEAKVRSGKPDDQYLLDIPINSKIETVHIPVSPPRLPLNTGAMTMERQ